MQDLGRIQRQLVHWFGSVAQFDGLEKKPTLWLHQRSDRKAQHDALAYNLTERIGQHPRPSRTGLRDKNDDTNLDMAGFELTDILRSVSQ